MSTKDESVVVEVLAYCHWYTTSSPSSTGVSTVDVEPWTEEPVAVEKAAVLEMWQYSLSEEASGTSARFLMPEDCDDKNLLLMVYGSNGWQPVEFTRQGSYLVFDLTEGDRAIALAQKETGLPVELILCAVAGVLALTLIAIVLRVKKKKKPAARQPDSGMEGSG